MLEQVRSSPGAGDKLSLHYSGDERSKLDRQNNLSDRFNLRDTSQQNEQYLGLVPPGWSWGRGTTRVPFRCSPQYLHWHRLHWRRRWRRHVLHASGGFYCCPYHRGSYFQHGYLSSLMLLEVKNTVLILSTST